MGAIISFITRAIVRRINREMIEYLDELGAPELDITPPNEPNPDDEEPFGRETENWALFNTEFVEEGPERIMYFSILNNRQERIVHGIVYQMLPDDTCNVLAYWIDPRDGNTYGVSLQHPIDFDGLRHLFS